MTFFTVPDFVHFFSGYDDRKDKFLPSGSLDFEQYPFLNLFLLAADNAQRVPFFVTDNFRSRRFFFVIHVFGREG